ncbi:S41 family peptidase [Sphingomonas sp. BN140010]|uniref:S41 family peptidase n=1 Tax=Sphingomonas arvum TaxID=2992113 RepID=A0ABT3JH58_9SPHN|nr:S41 family peptidase [Sphingomonas sp. BN140010]MCW3798402.1 S41 family peptidase [Sphingomonas sp. BN140010]
MLVQFRAFRCALVAALAYAAPAVLAAATPSAAVEEAITKIKAMAFRSPQVDWSALEARVRAAAEGAKDDVDLLRAYQILVGGLGDGHSFVNVSADDRALFKERYGHEFDSGRALKKPTSKFIGRRDPEVRQMAIGARQAALIVVPLKLGGGESARAYADVIYRGVTGAPLGTCGYVVDLRGNSGGNMWPMLAGLSSLLGDGWRSYELDASGKTTSYARLEKGAAVINDGEQKDLKIVGVSDWASHPALARAPVAVLIDDAVASSGEGVAVAFKGRPHTRFFGQQTFGVASSNEGFVVGDRVNIVVTTGMMVDRTGRTYPDGVPPDQQVPPSAASVAPGDDPVVKASARWLSSQPTCGRPRLRQERPRR